jgi:hypothetical protein
VRLVVFRPALPQAGFPLALPVLPLVPLRAVFLLEELLRVPPLVVFLPALRPEVSRLAVPGFLTASRIPRQSQCLQQLVWFRQPW